MMPTFFQDITLSVFTTLAPSGTFAVMVFAVMLLLPHEDAGELKKLEYFIILPLAIAIIGLITSATHLGNPENALYLFRGVGRSPLSTEIFLAVIFLFLGGVFWLRTFSLTQHRLVNRIWLLLLIAASIAFLAGMAFSYSVPTIASWDTPFVPLGLLTSACAGGAFLVLFTLRIANYQHLQGHVALAMSGLSFIGALATLTVTLLFAFHIMQLETAVSQGSELSVWLFGASVFFGICAAVSFSLMAAYLFGSQKNSVPTARFGIGCFLMFVGIFALRVAFYAVYLTVGL